MRGFFGALFHDAIEFRLIRHIDRVFFLHGAQSVRDRFADRDLKIAVALSFEATFRALDAFAAERGIDMKDADMALLNELWAESK